MQDNLSLPFSEVVGNSSPVQQAIKLVWEIFAVSPMPNNQSEKSRLTAKTIMLHMLGTMNSIGMINAAGYHSAAITLLRSIEDALDCFCSVSQDESIAEKWENGELKASDAAKKWTEGKQTDDSISMDEYRKNIRHAFNQYSHCTPKQTNWNLYRQSISNSQCKLMLNYQHAVIRRNGYFIDRYLCIHLHELIDVFKVYYSKYLIDNAEIAKELEELDLKIEEIIISFLADLGTDKLYMDTPPELIGIET